MGVTIPASQDHPEDCEGSRATGLTLLPSYLPLLFVVDLLTTLPLRCSLCALFALHDL